MVHAKSKTIEVREHLYVRMGIDSRILRHKMAGLAGNTLLRGQATSFFFSKIQNV